MAIKTLEQVVDADIFYRYIDGGPLDGNQKRMLTLFLETSEHPAEFINKVISLRMPQSALSYAQDALAAASVPKGTK